MSTRMDPRPTAGARALGVPLLVLALGAALLWGAANRTTEAPPDQMPTVRAPLGSASLVCPVTGSSDVNGSRTDLMVVSLTDDTGQERGRVSARVLPGGRLVPRLSLREPAVAATTTVPARESGVVEVQGVGTLAPGLAAFAGTTGSRAAGAGLAVAPCRPAARSWWFVGAGATVQHASTVVITNPDPADAIASIDIVGPDGPLEAVGTSGLVIPPGDSVAVDLTTVVALRDDLAIDVEASQGRVVVTVLDRFRDGVAPAGTEWLPAATTPTEVVTIPVAGTDGDRTLLVTNPGPRSAEVEAAVSDADGTFTPAGLGTVEVAPQSVATLQLPRTLGGDPLSVRLSSTVAITATLRTTAPGPVPDVEYAAASRPLSGPAAVPLHNGLTQLVLTGVDPQSDSSAVVESYRRDGSLLSAVPVDVPAGTTQAVGRFARGSSGPPAYVVVSPQQGALHASAVYQGSTGSSLLALSTPAQTTLAPRVSARE